MRRCIQLLAAVGLCIGLAAPLVGLAQSDTRIGGLATDQPCSPIVAVDELVPVGIAVHELVPMVLTQEQLGTSGPDWYQDSWYGRYNDDAELAQLGLFSDQETCDRLAEFGRVTGYSGSWEQWHEDAVERRASSVHLFLDEPGAAAFLEWLPEQLPGSPSIDDGQAGTDVLEEVVTEPIPGLGPGAGAMLIRRTSGTQAWAWVQRGAIVGTVALLEPEASATEATRLAGDLAERIAAAPFETEEGAATAWAESLTEAEAAAGVDSERFVVPGVEGAVGTRRPVNAGDVTYSDTRVAFLHGPAIVTIFIHDQSETDRRAEMAALALKLAERVERVLPLAPVTSGS